MEVSRIDPLTKELIVQEPPDLSKSFNGCVTESFLHEKNIIAMVIETNILRLLIYDGSG